MSWCDTPVRKLVAIVSLALLAGCFRPMYGEHTGSTPVLQELSGIDVQPIGGRVGQQIRNELLYAFQPNAVAGTPYKLSVTLKQSAEAIILRRSGEAEKSILELRANFALIETATGKDVAGAVIEFIERSAPQGSTRDRGKG